MEEIWEDAHKDSNCHNLFGVHRSFVWAQFTFLSWITHSVNAKITIFTWNIINDVARWLKRKLWCVWICWKLRIHNIQARFSGTLAGRNFRTLFHSHTSLYGGRYCVPFRFSHFLLEYRSIFSFTTQRPNDMSLLLLTIEMSRTRTKGFLWCNQIKLCVSDYLFIVFCCLFSVNCSLNICGAERTFIGDFH